MYNEKSLEWQRNWRKKNPEKYKEYYSNYNKEHKEQYSKKYSERWRNDPEWREKRYQKKLEWLRNFRLMFKAYLSRPDIKLRLHKGESREQILKEYKDLRKQNKLCKKQI